MSRAESNIRPIDSKKVMKEHNILTTIGITIRNRNNSDRITFMKNHI